MGGTTVMTSNDQAGDVATYAASVRAALSDLPSDQAEVLLEDLEDHLREIAADAGGPLAERLGSPEQYAKELRAAYGAAQAGSRRPEPAFGDVRRVVTWVEVSLVSRASCLSSATATSVVGPSR